MSKAPSRRGSLRRRDSRAEPKRLTTNEKRAFAAGWLYKKNPKGLPGMRLWKSRFCVITPEKVEYYVGEDRKTMKGTIMLNRIIDIDVVPPTDEKMKHEGRFLIHVKGSKRIYEFRAPSAEMCDLWVDKLEEAVKRAKQQQYN